jgi:O-antigen/teichoic acid export membrane protein
LSQNGHKKKAITGSLWVFCGYGVSQLLRLGSNLILGHLLFPAAFGLMALVTVLMTGITMFSDLGIGPSIIQNKRGEDPAFINTAWTLQVIRGGALWIVTCLLAWPAAHYFGKSDPMARQLLWILPVVGFSAVLGGFASTSIFTLNRQLKMGTLAMFDLTQQIVSLGVTIALARIYPSVWDLVAGYLVSFLVRLPLSHYFNRPFHNRFVWDQKALKEITHFGRWIFLGTIVSFLAGGLDRILLGRMVSMTELGLYSMALGFAKVGIDVTAKVNAYVLFPLVSKYQQDSGILLAHSLRARGLILLLGGSLSGAFAIVAPLFFKYCYDPRYAAAGQISQWLALYIWASILLNSMDFIPLALGQSRANFVSKIIGLGGYLMAIPAYHIFALPGFIFALSAGLLASHLLLVAMLPLDRLKMLIQSLKYSLIFLLYTAAIIVWIRYGGISSPHAVVTLSLLGSFLPCALAGLICYKELASVRK